MNRKLKNYQVILVGVFSILLFTAIGWRVIGSRGYYPEIGINLVIVGENNVAIVGVSKDEESLIWVDLPEKLKIDGYPVTSIWGLGEIDGNSDKLIIQRFGEGLGLWLHAVAKIDKGEPTIDGLLNRLLSLKPIRGLNLLDKYTLYKDISFLSSKGIVFETGLPYQVMDKVQDVDGYEWLELNEAVFVWSRDLWPKMEVVNSGIRVSVVNTSEIPGAARLKARQLESVGFRVIGVEAGNEIADDACSVEFKFGAKDENEVIKRIIRDYLNCNIKTIEDKNEYLGDVVFYVG